MTQPNIVCVLQWFDTYGDLYHVDIFDNEGDMNRHIKAQKRSDLFHSERHYMVMEPLVDPAQPIANAFPEVEVVDHRPQVVNHA